MNTLYSKPGIINFYLQVHLVIYDTSSWSVTKDSKSKFDAMIINIYDMALCNLKKGWELIWPTMFQINFWNINTGVERVALKSVSFDCFSVLSFEAPGNGKGCFLLMY